MITHVKIDTGLDIESEMNCTSMFRDIMHLRHELNNLANSVAATMDLRGSEMAIIDTLGRFGALTMSDLAAACFFSPPERNLHGQVTGKKQAAQTHSIEKFATRGDCGADTIRRGGIQEELPEHPARSQRLL